MKILDVPQTGKRGAVVGVTSRHGQILRQHFAPKNPRTPAQMRIRSNLSRVSARWRALTEEQRAAWMISAQKAATRRRLGRSSYLTGCQFFIKINCARLAVGLDWLLDPPDAPKFGVNPVGNLTIVNSEGDIALKLKVPGTPAAAIIVLGIAPCSAGISYAWNFVTLGLLPAPASGVSDITDLYVSRFGVPPAGTRVFIRTRQQINGWEDAPKQTSAIVPKA